MNMRERSEACGGSDWEFFQNVVVIKMGEKRLFFFGRGGVIEDLCLAFTRY